MTSRGGFRGRGASAGGGKGGGNFGYRGGLNKLFPQALAKPNEWCTTGRGNFQQSYGPPAQILELGSFLHACEGEIVCESNNPKIPYFNAPIYLENKTSIGKVDEILGPINQVHFTIKPQEGIQATSFKSGDKFYIGGDKLLPLEKFLPKPKPPPGAGRVKKAGGAGRGGARGRGAPRARGGSRVAPRGRGGFGDRGRGRGGIGSFSSGRGGSRGGFGSRGGGFRGRG